MGTSVSTDEQVKEMALQGLLRIIPFLQFCLHSRVDVEGVLFVEERFHITRLSHNSISHQCPGKEGGRLHSLSGQLYLF